MGKKVICLILYVWDVEKINAWSRYAAGVIEWTRALPHVFPGYDLHLTLGSDTLGLISDTRWFEPLKRTINDHFKHVHYIYIDRSSADKHNDPQMAPLLMRYDCLAPLAVDYDTILFRDVDSPPTPADAAAVALCEQKDWCAMSMLQLPIYGTEICGGGVSFFNCKHNVAPHIERARAHTDSERCSRCKDQWGVDETYLADLTENLYMWDGRITIDLFHCPETRTYYTGPDFDIPFIDRLNEDATEQCHWNMIQAPTRAGGLTRFECMGATLDLGPLPPMEAVMSKDLRKVYVMQKAAPYENKSFSRLQCRPGALDQGLACPREQLSWEESTV